MSYSNQTRYEQLLGQIVPIPRQAHALDGAPQAAAISCFHVGFSINET